MCVELQRRGDVVRELPVVCLVQEGLLVFNNLPVARQLLQLLVRCDRRESFGCALLPS